MIKFMCAECGYCTEIHTVPTKCPKCGTGRVLKTKDPGGVGAMAGTAPDAFDEISMSSEDCNDISERMKDAILSAAEGAPVMNPVVIEILFLQSFGLSKKEAVRAAYGMSELDGLMDFLEWTEEHVPEWEPCPKAVEHGPQYCKEYCTVKEDCLGDELLSKVKL